jgi:predicted MFS family arabinose efflux permease
MQKNTNIDFNSTGVVTSGVILGTVGVLSFIVQPGLVQGFVTEIGLSEADANALAFDEMLGVAIATFATSFVKTRFSWRHILMIALSFAMIGNLFSAFAVKSPEFLSSARFIAGLGEGAIISLSFTIVGLTKRVERNLAAYLTLLLTYGALGIWLMPKAFDVIGIQGIFLIWAVLTSFSFYLVKFTPCAADQVDHAESESLDMPIPIRFLALLGVLLFNLAIGVAWANLFLIGMEIEPNEQAIANALLISQFVAILGALIPVFMERRLGLFKPIALTLIVSSVSIALLLDNPSLTIFVIAVSGFNFMWNFGLPFVLSGVGNLDKKGHMISLAIALQMTGLGFGPFFAALILGNDGSFYDVEIFVITLYLLSAIPLLFALKAHRNKLSSLS